jgi:hypothetical protein
MFKFSKEHRSVEGSNVAAFGSFDETMHANLNQIAEGATYQL